MSQRPPTPFFAWRGPWILAVFTSEEEKLHWLDALVKVFFNGDEGDLRALGTIRSLQSDTYNDPKNVMLDLVDCMPKPDNRPTSIQVELDGKSMNFPILFKAAAA